MYAVTAMDCEAVPPLVERVVRGAPALDSAGVLAPALGAFSMRAGGARSPPLPRPGPEAALRRERSATMRGRRT